MNPKNTLKATFTAGAMAAAFAAQSHAAVLVVPDNLGTDSSSYGTTSVSNSETYGSAKLFDGTPTVGSAASLGGEFASNHETDPTAEFSFNAPVSLDGIGYAERADSLTPGFALEDSVTEVDLYFVTATQYANFVPTKGQTPADTAAALGVTGPSEAIIVDPTTLSFETYNFSSTSAQYIIAQFDGVAPTSTLLGNPGGAELRFQEAAVPEPGTYSLFGLGLGALALTLRRLRSFVG